MKGKTRERKILDNPDFSQVGAFHFPLTVAIPCLRTPEVHFILPLQSEVFYGLVLPA